MLLVLLSIFFQYKLVNCISTNQTAPSFNETHLSEQLHQSFLQVNAFLKDIQHNIHDERSALRTVDYEAATSTKDMDFMDYSLTNIWWNDSQATGANTAQTNFLPTHKNHGRDIILTTTVTSASRHTYPTYRLPGYVPKFTYDTPSSIPVPPKFNTVNFSYITRPTFPFSIPTEVTETVIWDETLTPGPYHPGHPLYRPPSTLGPWTPIRRFTTQTYAPSDNQPHTEGEAVPAPAPESPDKDYSWPTLKQPTSAEIRSSGYPWPSLKPPGLTTSEADRNRTTYYLFKPEDYTYVELDADKNETSTPSVSSIITTLHPNISRYVQDWLKQMNSTKSVNIEDWLLTTNVDPRLPTGKPSNTLDNWLPKNRLDQNSSQYLSPAIHRQGPPPSTTPDPDFATASEDPWMPTATGKQGEFFLEGSDGLIYLGTTPKFDENTKTTVVAEGIAYLPKELNMNVTSTVAGDVLYGELKPPTPKDTYKEALITEMDSNQLGYMLTYLIKLTELVATKNPKHVREVVIHAEKIVVDLFNMGRLAWFGEPLVQVTMNLGIFLSEMDIDTVQSYSAMVHNMLKGRKEHLAIDVNSIIDYAELLYEDDEGLLLFDIIKEFDDYPNITKNSFELADDLIEYFLAPYRRLKDSERRQALLDSVNYALTVRFPNIHRRFEDNLATFRPRGNVHKSTTRQYFQKVRSRAKENQKKNIPIKPRQRSNYKKTKRRNLEPIHSEFNYENILRRNYDFGTEFIPQLRRTKPIITNIQKRFSVITSAQHERFRGIMTRSYMNPNTLYINLAATRRTTDYKTVTTNFFLQHPVPDRAASRGYRNRAPAFPRNDIPRRTTRKFVQHEVTSFMNEMKKRFMVSQAKKKAQKLKFKAELIRKIAEGSSYSDEEASLKMNLIDALLYRHNKTKKPGGRSKMTAEPESEFRGLDSLPKTPSKNGNDEEDRQNGI